MFRELKNEIKQLLKNKTKDWYVRLTCSYIPNQTVLIFSVSFCSFYSFIYFLAKFSYFWKIAKMKKTRPINLTCHRTLYIFLFLLFLFVNWDLFTFIFTAFSLQPLAILLNFLRIIWGDPIDSAYPCSFIIIFLLSIKFVVGLKLIWHLIFCREFYSFEKISLHLCNNFCWKYRLRFSLNRRWIFY